MAALTNQERRPASPLSLLPEEVLTFQPEVTVRLDKKLFLESLRKAPRGSAAGLTGLRFEHAKALLDNEANTDLLYALLQKVARVEIPAEAATVLRTGSLVALRKPDGGVRGIVVGETLRRLTAKTLAKQYAKGHDTGV